MMIIKINYGGLIQILIIEVNTSIQTIRYYRLNSAINSNFNNGAPNQEVNGNVNVKFIKTGV